MDSSRGLTVVRTLENSYGSAIGIKVGDVILAYNSVQLSSVEQLINLIKRSPNQEIKIKIFRDGNEIELKAEGKSLNLVLQPLALQPKTATQILQSASYLPAVFYILAALDLFGGIALSLTFWPDDLTHDAELEEFLSITWFMAGSVGCALLLAIGKGLTYLEQLVINTSSAPQ